MSASFVQTYRAFAYNNAWANYRLLTLVQIFIRRILKPNEQASSRVCR
jgi:hypothetical protein